MNRSSACAVAMLVGLAALLAACAPSRRVESGEPAAPRRELEGPLRIVVFSDFNCRVCRQSQPMYERLAAEFGDRVEIVKRPMSWNGRPSSLAPDAYPARSSYLAAVVWYAARRQGRADAMGEVLYSNPFRFAIPQLEAYAREAGLDVEAFGRDLRDPDLLDRVDANRRDAVALGVEHTPGVAIGEKRLQGRQDYEALAAAVRSALSRGIQTHDTPEQVASPGLDWQSLVYPVGELAPRATEPKIAVGDPAPDFALPSILGPRVTLSAYRGSHIVVLSFVPAAWTPVCSAQWPEYAQRRVEFGTLGAQVIGITTDNIPTLHAWTTAMGPIDFPVLSDFWPHGDTARAYGILRPDSGVAERATFIVDRAGIVRYVDIHDINSAPSTDRILEEVRRIAAP